MKHHFFIWGGLASLIAGEQLRNRLTGTETEGLWILAGFALFFGGHWFVLRGMYLYGRADERKGKP